VAKAGSGLPDPKRSRPALPAWFVNALTSLLFTAKGDLLSASAPATPLILPVGAPGTFLQVNWATPTGLQWAAIPTGLNFVALWNATTNVPAIVSGVGNNGDYYIVNVAGNTVIDGEGDWQVDDWIVFSAAAGAWQKMDHSSSPWMRNTRVLAGTGPQLITDDVIEVTAPGVLTLLAAPQARLTITIVRNYAIGANYQINGNGNLISGAASAFLFFNWQSTTLHFTGTQWLVI